MQTYVDNVFIFIDVFILYNKPLSAYIYTLCGLLICNKYTLSSLLIYNKPLSVYFDIQQAVYFDIL